MIGGAIVSHAYRGEVREIVQDFLRALEKRGDVDPDFLATLKQLAEAGRLGNRSDVKQAMRNLEARNGDDEA